MDAQQQANVFRMSATLFANNNYQISPVQLHRKVIEDALFVMNNEDGVTLGVLADYIEKEYFFNFGEQELTKVLHDPKFGHIFVSKVSAGCDTLYLLKKERREHINANKNRTLDDYIQEYLSINKLGIVQKEAIYQYLYGVFTTNVDSFKRMLEARNVKTLTEHYTPKDEDVEVINGFLDWENPEKNRAIFNLASYALEFCLLTSKKDSSLKLDSLSHKVFYLDTNILYRAIGINGEERKLRSLSFLRKLRESNDNIRISKVAWEEYEASQKKYIKLLRRSETPVVRSKVYTEYVSYDDMYRYYHLWAANRSNSTIDLFVNWLEAAMKEIIEDYNITIDSFTPYSPEEKKDSLEEMAAQIQGFSRIKPFEAAHNDACNVLWVESSRKPGETSIFSAKTFLISSDQGLYSWDSKYHSKQAPIVILPSQWLSLLLRYVSRSNDDFRSFVCFLNIQEKEGILSPEQINAILVGISEMTDNVDQQKYFLETIIEREFKDGVKGKTNDQLRVIARTQTERMLQYQVEQMRKEHENLRGTLSEVQQQLAEHKSKTEEQLNSKSTELEQAAKTIENLKSNVEILKAGHQEKQNTLVAKEERIKQLEDQVLYEQDKYKFYKRRRRNIAWCIFGLIVLLSILFWFFVATSATNDPMGWLLKQIDTMDETHRTVAKAIIVLIVSLGIIPVAKCLGKELASKFEE
ncbi:hypothetical protein [Segatella baroniae]|uniref:hypothetical protein n=1 Tax=Segatella baroniae TaxID=305719 RepID=UPI0003F7A7E1|nr:hypothetical protein [Segatella baroniae]